MTALWTSSEMEAATLGWASRLFEVDGLSIDTRSLKPGDLFVALKGDNRDGHDFIAAAFERKAAGALVSKRPEGAGKRPLLTVGHTLRALEDLARASRARTNAKLVAVTGSVGKTTTKEILRVALSALGVTHWSAASFNNHWGVPLSLASMPREARYGVFEIGMNHFGEIRTLNAIVRPHAALITAIAPAHLEFFGNLEAIADAKSEIFEAIVPGGAVLIPADSPQRDRLIARARQAGVAQILTFGRNESADARLIDAKEDSSGQHLKADILGKPVEARLGAHGVHIAVDTVGALAAVMLLEGDVFNAAASLKTFSALKGRGERFDVNGLHLIDESYNANPASMAAAFALLKGAPGRRIAVLGDMLEMGDEAPRFHAALAENLADAGVDLVFSSGPLMESLFSALPEKRRGGHAGTPEALLPSLKKALKRGDTVLVKGSKASKMSVVVDALKAE
jgi:UDP-N-acetylmuramoyl-tripeptide--D-alanyl-D-alanine ligase